MQYSIISLIDLTPPPPSCSHENGGGFYRVSSYFISKIITDIIPLRLIPVVLFSVISYFMMGKSLMPIALVVSK